MPIKRFEYKYKKIKNVNIKKLLFAVFCGVCLWYYGFGIKLKSMVNGL